MKVVEVGPYALSAGMHALRANFPKGSHNHPSAHALSPPISAQCLQYADAGYTYIIIPRFTFVFFFLNQHLSNNSKAYFAAFKKKCHNGRSRNTSRIHPSVIRRVCSKEL